MQSLLRERFHAQLNLRTTAGGDYELGIPDSGRCVRIHCDYSAFLGDPEQMGCGEWRSTEGTWFPAAWGSLPMPGMAACPGSCVEQSDQGCSLRYDLLSLAYWMLSRREEVGSRKLDIHGRFPAVASHGYRHGYLDRPIVDEWFEVLRRAIQATWPSLALHSPRYEMRLSHDVDTPARYALVSPLRLVRNMMIDLLRDRHRDRRAFRQAPLIWARSRERLDPRDPFNTFDWIMDRSEEVGLRNAFYFLCGRTHRRYDAHYEPDDPAIIDLMRRIHARGHEVGLHPSFNTYRNPGKLRTEFERLRHTCKRAGIPVQRPGVRMHYLRWQTPDTLQGLDAAGLHYDTTLGYADRPGFRCGTCFEYQAFDVQHGRPLALRLRPLVVMESTVINGMTPSDMPAAEAELLKLMQACRRVNGCFTLLWHNTMLEHPHQRRLYERVIAHHKDLSN